MYPRVMLVAGDQAVYQLVDRTFGRAQFDLLVVDASDDVIEFAQWAEPDLVVLAHPRLSVSLRICQDLRRLRPMARPRTVVLAAKAALREMSFDGLGCADAVLALPLDSAGSLEHLRDQLFHEGMDLSTRHSSATEALWT